MDMGVICNYSGSMSSDWYYYFFRNIDFWMKGKSEK